MLWLVFAILLVAQPYAMMGGMMGQGMMDEDMGPGMMNEEHGESGSGEISEHQSGEGEMHEEGQITLPACPSLSSEMIARVIIAQLGNVEIVGEPKLIYCKNMKAIYEVKVKINGELKTVKVVKAAGSPVQVILAGNATLRIPKRVGVIVEVVPVKIRAPSVWFLNQETIVDLKYGRVVGTNKNVTSALIGAIGYKPFEITIDGPGCYRADLVNRTVDKVENCSKPAPVKPLPIQPMEGEVEIKAGGHGRANYEGEYKAEVEYEARGQMGQRGEMGPGMGPGMMGKGEAREHAAIGGQGAMGPQMGMMEQMMRERFGGQVKIVKVVPKGDGRVLVIYKRPMMIPFLNIALPIETEGEIEMEVSEES